MKLIDKEILLLKIDSKIEEAQKVFNVAPSSVIGGMIEGYTRTKKIISSLEVKEVDLEEEPVSDDWLDMSKIDCKIQYANIESGIHAHAEDYSFNIESQLFNQLTKEQQELWRKEIEQAIISGGHCGVELARDKRYKENQELVSVYLEEAAIDYATKEAAKDISGDWTTDDILNAFKAGANAVIEEITACLPKTNCANPNEVLDIIVAKIKELKGK